MSEQNRLHKIKVLNAGHLKIIAMVCMLIDHTWGVLMTDNQWMNCVGRIAFPIFAFQIAEGYVRTKNFKKYLLRMFLFALISEIPYNYMTGGGWFNPVGQNVMFTFCLALLMIRLIDRASGRPWVLRLLITLAVLLLGYLLGIVTFVDYHGTGVLMVLVFYLFRNVKFGWLIQLAAMICINCFMIGGLGFRLGEVFIPNQAFAVLALIPIWLYNGEQGWKSKGFRYAVYAFYPIHIAILVVIAML